eukprot:gene1084-1230_t
MEHIGIAFDYHVTQQNKDLVLAKLEYLEHKAKLSVPDMEFSLVSTKDASNIIFRHLKLGDEKMNRSYEQQCTNGDVLESLAHQLPRFCSFDASGQNARIHSTILLTNTGTGRLAMTFPNLQNVSNTIEFTTAPTSYDRSAPSQSYQESPTNINWNQEVNPYLDIIDTVTDEQRTLAKRLNYGIFYGMGAGSLARKLGWSKEEAKKQIQSLKSCYHELMTWMNRVEDDFVKKKYVETLYGRRRYDVQTDSMTLSEAGSAKRRAVNSVAQGTAADIVKYAMIQIDKEFEALNVQATMVLMVHDELIKSEHLITDIERVIMSDTKVANKSTRLRQTKILLRKNFILLKRSYRGTIIQVLVPFLFVFFLWILQFGIKANAKSDEAVQVFDNPQPQIISNIPRCIIGPKLDYCFTVAYVPDSKGIGEYVMQKIIADNKIPKEEVSVFNNSTDLDVFLDMNHNSTMVAVVFTMNDTTNQLHYSLMYNKTATYVNTKEVILPGYVELPWLKVLEQELARNVTNNPSLVHKIDFTEYAHPELVIQDVIGDMGPTFFFAALMFNVVIQLGQIVLEKELKLREGMNMMGLKDSVYWFTWLVTNVITNVISACILTASGYIFQFDFFKKNAFGTFFFLFVLFGVAMVTFVFFLSTIIKKSDIATSIGFVIFLAGIIIQGFASFAFEESFYTAVRIILSLLPFALLSKGISDLSNASGGSTASGLAWSDIGSNAWFSLRDVYGWLIFDFFFFLVIALYLDNVVPSTYGTSKGMFYFLTPSYWVSSPSKPKAAKIKKEKKSKNSKEIELNEDEDEDVALERQNVLSDNLPADNAVKIVNLRKVYTQSKCCAKSKQFVAVKGTCLSIGQGQLFVLLGHNGAGKTTTFNMMTGMFSPSSGDAHVFGHSIISNMPAIRNVMGVCPQHDILWNELSGREHLEIFAAFKGIPDNKIKAEVEERLKDVELVSAQHIPCGKYSGGMRRRLSTAIALIGDPKIVYLDEPTTGMDPVSRRQVWNLVEKVKKGRVIILTTHSMEEADVLGDRIGIMKKGKIVCLGTSLRLKNKFGAGYRLVVLLDSSAANGVETVTKFFEMHLNIKPAGEAIGQLEFNVARDQLENLMSFFEKLEHAKSLLPIRDVQISMTTLEEVFLHIAGHDE